MKFKEKGCKKETKEEYNIQENFIRLVETIKIIKKISKK